MDDVFLNQIKAYKNTQSSKYIPVRGDEILTRVFEFEKYFVSTKIDGHLCFILKKGKEIVITNFNGKLFDRSELIDELNKNIRENTNKYNSYCERNQNSFFSVI